jgi:hypothetical protein
MLEAISNRTGLKIHTLETRYRAGLRGEALEAPTHSHQVYHKRKPHINSKGWAG